MAGQSRPTQKLEALMAATIKDISDFFKTGDPSRDKLGSFRAEWEALTEAERAVLKFEVGKAIGK
jgi:carboxylesterase type B